MPELNFAAVLVAAVASFVASAAWYVIFGNAMVRLQGAWRGAVAPDRPEPWRMLVFLAIAVALAFAVATVMGLAGISGWFASLCFGLLLWAGFVATQWIGSIVGEGVPLGLAAIHAGDWLGHLLIICLILGIWR